MKHHQEPSTQEVLAGLVERVTFHNASDVASARPLDPFAPSQFQHLDLVEARDRLEVEAVQTFDRRELRRLDPTLDHPPFAVDHLQFHQPAEELDMVQPLGGALPGQLLVFPQEGRKVGSLSVLR
jgi:hypothetical protein